MVGSRSDSVPISKKTTNQLKSKIVPEPQKQDAPLKFEIQIEGKDKEG